MTDAIAAHLSIWTALGITVLAGLALRVVGIQTLILDLVVLLLSLAAVLLTLRARRRDQSPV